MGDISTATAKSNVYVRQVNNIAVMVLVLKSAFALQELRTLRPHCVAQALQEQQRREMWSFRGIN